jgi:hypothetical protein
VRNDGRDHIGMVARRRRRSRVPVRSTRGAAGERTLATPTYSRLIASARAPDREDPSWLLVT